MLKHNAEMIQNDIKMMPTNVLTLMQKVVQTRLPKRVQNDTNMMLKHLQKNVKKCYHKDATDA